MALKYTDQVGQQEDWANMVTNVQMVDTPILGWLPVGKEIVSAERLYQGDVYDDPAENSHPDGKPVTGAKSAGRNRKPLRSVIQYSTKAANVTKLTQDYGNQAAPSDELATEISKQTKELSKDMEAAIASAQECRVGVSGTTGYKTRGIPNWIQRSAQAVYPVDSALYPAAAQVDTSITTANLDEDDVLNVLQGIGTTTRGSEVVTAFVGPSAKRQFNNFPVFIPSAATTVNSGAYPSPIRGGVLDRGIHRYVSDFAPVDLIVSYNNFALGSVAVEKSHGTFYLHQSKWELAWGSKPKWMQKAYEGGQYEAFCEAIWMLTCWNPMSEAKWQPAS